jgi:hypothetical protein
MAEDKTPTSAQPERIGRAAAFRAGVATGAKLGAALGAACGVMLALANLYFDARIGGSAEPGSAWTLPSILATLGGIVLFAAYGIVAGAAIVGLAGLWRPGSKNGTGPISPS